MSDKPETEFERFARIRREQRGEVWEQRTIENCARDDHTWRQVYYGQRCSICDYFIPDVESDDEEGNGEG